MNTFREHRAHPGGCFPKKAGHVISDVTLVLKFQKVSLFRFFPAFCYLFLSLLFFFGRFCLSLENLMVFAVSEEPVEKGGYFG